MTFEGYGLVSDAGARHEGSAVVQKLRPMVAVVSSIPDGMAVAVDPGDSSAEGMGGTPHLECHEQVAVRVSLYADRMGVPDE